jgi:hypothetical protein
MRLMQLMGLWGLLSFEADVYFVVQVTVEAVVGVRPVVLMSEWSWCG